MNCQEIAHKLSGMRYDDILDNLSKEMIGSMRADGITVAYMHGNTLLCLGYIHGCFQLHAGNQESASDASEAVHTFGIAKGGSLLSPCKDAWHFCGISSFVRENTRQLTITHTKPKISFPDGDGSWSVSVVIKDMPFCSFAYDFKGGRSFGVVFDIKDIYPEYWHIPRLLQLLKNGETSEAIRLLEELQLSNSLLSSTF